jgi:hypothetical protein
MEERGLRPGFLTSDGPGKVSSCRTHDSSSAGGARARAEGTRLPCSVSAVASVAPNDFVARTLRVLDARATRPAVGPVAQLVERQQTSLSIEIVRL